MNKHLDEVREGVMRYCNAVHTQEKEDFYPLWAEGVEAVLISPGGKHDGVDRIYEDFLLKGIRGAFARIDLIADHIELRQLSEDAVSVVFAYHTECIRRDTGEPFGIAGLETQLWILQNGAWKLAHVHYSGQK